MNKLVELLNSEQTILLDGAMGTMLMNSGLEQGGAEVFWVETMSDIDEVRAAVAGARLIGACCGSTAAHVRAMATANIFEYIEVFNNRRRRHLRTIGND